MEKKQRSGRAGDLHAGHRERMRTRFLERGVRDMEDHQILELMLFYALPRVDTNPVARQLLAEFGSLNNVLNAPIQSLLTVPGVGEETAVYLKLFRTVKDRAEQAQADKIEWILERNDVKRVLSPMLADAVSETLVCAMTDAGGRILRKCVVDVGGFRSVTANAETILRQALLNNAQGVAIGHTHPQGFAVPSREDVESTRSLSQRLGAAGVRLLEHMIFAQDGVFFLSTYGRLGQGVLTFSER